MAELKTRPTTANVKQFISKVADEQMRKDSEVIVDLMRDATGDEPQMWGPAIIGFGKIKMKSGASGKEMDWFKIGFSPRKANLALYLSGSLQSHAAALKKLGKHTTGVSCLYIKRLADVDVDVLKGMIEAGKG